MSAAQLTTLPGTTHSTIIARTDLLQSIITLFLDGETTSASERTNP
jgi:hypothetical protein